MYKCIDHGEIDVSFIDKKVMEDYPPTVRMKEVLSMLAFGKNSSGIIPVLQGHIDSGQGSISKPARLLLIKHFAQLSFPNVISAVHHELFSLLSMKGTSMYSIDFGRISQINLLAKHQADELKNIRSELLTALGSPVTSLSIVKEALYLRKIFGDGSINN